MRTTVRIKVVVTHVNAPTGGDVTATDVFVKSFDKLESQFSKVIHNLLPKLSGSMPRATKLRLKMSGFISKSTHF